MAQEGNKDMKNRDGPSDAGSIDAAALETIKKQIRSDALQHPATIFPFGISMLSLVYLVFAAPFTGGASLALAGALGFGGASVASVGWHWRIRGKKYLEKKAKEFALLKERLQKEAAEKALSDLEVRVRDGFEEIRFGEGCKAFEELAHEYQELRALLARLPVGSSLAGSHLLSKERVEELATSTYCQGLSVLSDALEIKRAVYRTDTRGLEAEITELTKTIARLKNDPAQAALAALKEETLESHKERLVILRQQELNTEELLQQADRCEAALQKVRIELPSLKGRGSQRDIEELVISLEVTMNYAKEVQDRLREHGLL